MPRTVPQLTPKQLATFDAFKAIEKEGVPAQIQRVADIMGVSLSTAFDHIEQLVIKKMLKKVAFGEGQHRYYTKNFCPTCGRNITKKR